MGILRNWWQALTGRPPAAHEPPPHGTAKRPAQPRADADGGDGLRLADSPPGKRPSRLGAAGFDPYASDAGFTKPHSWERVDHD